MHFTFILNPIAGNGRVGRRRGRLEKEIAAAGLAAEILISEGPGHAEALAVDAARDGDAVVAVGGDGTVHEVGLGLVRSGRRAHLGVLPLGTGNDFVKLIGMPGNIGAGVRALAEALPEAVDAGRVRCEEQSGSVESLFLNAVGAGFDAAVAQIAPSYKFLPGVAGYLVAVLRTLGSWNAPHADIRVESGEETFRYQRPLFLVTAGNGISSGGGFYLTPDASATDGLLDVCIIDNLPVRRVITLIPAALRGGHVSEPEVTMRRASRIVIELSAPVPVHVDGEILSGAVVRMEVDVLPAAISVLFPRQRPPQVKM